MKIMKKDINVLQVLKYAAKYGMFRPNRIQQVGQFPACDTADPPIRVVFISDQRKLGKYSGSRRTCSAGD